MRRTSLKLKMLAGVVTASAFSVTACSAENTATEKIEPVAKAIQAETKTKETIELESITPDFDRDLIKVADNVHAAIGYGASVISFIEGDDGIVLIDAGQMPGASAEALAAYREISDKPVKGIVFTHSHGDHVNGAAAFMSADDNVEVWARDNYGSETAAFNKSGLKINRLRGIRQAGFKLPPEKRINNGVAPAVYPTGPGAFNPTAAIVPNKTFADSVKIEISGVSLDLVANEGETSDQIYVWYEDKEIVFAGDNFYQSWPNLYAIRGTPYRDVMKWGDAADRMLQLNADTLVGGHTLPIIGRENVSKALTAYRDGIRYIFEKTVEGMNKGLTPNELVDYAKLPEALASNRLLRPYYGNPDWAVRAIFTGYLGWFDGNPTNLFPLTDHAEAERMAALAGGKEKLSEAMTVALDAEDYQWAAQLADYLISLNPNDSAARLSKAMALEGLATNQLTATARNYYHTVAQELTANATE